VGSGSSTVTCTITGHAVGTYLAKATYVPGANPDYLTATTPSFLGMYVGSDSTNPMSTTAGENFTVNATGGGSTTLSAGDQLKITASVTIIGITGVISPGFTSGTTPTAKFTLGTGQSTFGATTFTCSVTTTSPGTTCNTTGSLLITASSGTPAYIDLQAQLLVSGDSFTGYWIVTYTQ
jgi:hypothetical protein